MKKTILSFLLLFYSIHNFAQFPENFEDPLVTVPNGFPAGWLVTDNGVGTSNSWEIVTNQTVVINGTKSAYINRENIGLGYTSEDWLISPLTTIPINGELKFKSKQTLAGDNGTIYQVRMSTGAFQSDFTAYTILAEWTEAEMNAIYNVAEEKSVYFPVNSIGSTVYFAFVRVYTQPTAATGGDRWILDDIIVQQGCVSPTGIVATDIIDASAQLSWNAIEGIVNYEIELLPDTVEPTGTPTHLTPTNSFTLSLLDANLNYKFYIRANCAEGSYSSWAGPFFIGTSLCPKPNQMWASNATTTTANLNWSETGSSTQWEVLLLAAPNSTVPAAPGIIPVVGINDVYIQNLTSNTTTVTGLSPATIYYYYARSICSSGDGASSWSGPFIFNTVICTTEEACTYKFHLTNQGGNSWNGGLMQVRQNGIVIATLGYSMVNSFPTQISICNNVPFEVYWNAVGVAPEQMGLSIESANGDTVYIKQPGVGTPLTVLYSDTSLGNCDAASCPSPHDLMNSSQSATMANLSWEQLGSANQWEVYVAAAGSPAPLNNTPLNTGTLGYYLSNTNTNFLIPGLSVPGTLDFYVRALCSSDDFSTWTKLKVILNDKIELVAFIDTNNDGIKNVYEEEEDGEDEVDFTYGVFTSIQNNVGPTSYLSSSEGMITIFDNDPTNSYNFNYEIDSQYAGFYSLAPTNFNAITVAEWSGTQTLYFPITITQSYTDVEVVIGNDNNLMPGFNSSQRVFYKNYGSATASGIISYTIDNPNVSITSLIPNTTVFNTSGFTQSYADLLPGEIRSTLVYLNTATLPSISLGTEVTFSATNTANVADVNAGNDTFSLVKTVVGSYDPNDKSEARGSNVPIGQFLQDDYLFYTIRFQNSGTASAQTVRIEDTLESQFDFASVRMMSASHDYTMERVNNKLTWTFNDIDLPAESVNEPGSHGYVTFKIKLNPGFAVGDVIANTAEIYFDFNPAIITNTFQTTFVPNLGVGSFDVNNVVVYPNPAKEMVYVQLKNSTETLQKVVIYDMIGKAILSLSANNTQQASLNVGTLSSGVYMIEITTDSNLKLTRKFIVN